MTAKMACNEDDFVKCLIAAFTNPEVIDMLQTAVCGKLQAEINDLKTMIAKKDDTIDSLSKQVSSLEKKCDDLEQYSRRNSLRIYGIAEDAAHTGESIDEKVLALVNSDFEVTPPLTPD